MHRSFAVLSLSLGLVASGLHAQTLGGTWTLYPQQTQTLQAKVSGAINPDGSSVWSTKSTVPVQYDLQQSLGPVIFASYQSATPPYQPATPPWSYLDFSFTNPVLFEDITTLSANYQFAHGNCHGGSLRWSFNLADGSTVYAYYGNPTAFDDCTTSGSNQSGTNLLLPTLQTDSRFEIQGNGAPVYIPYSDVLLAKRGVAVKSVTLVLDGGWGGDQVFAAGYPMNVTVGTSSSSATFVPASSTPTPVCPTQPATIQISKMGSSGGYTVDESLVSTVPDQGTSFRISGCKYMYNISGKSLGAGQYQVDALINGDPLAQPAPGTLFVLK